MPNVINLIAPQDNKVVETELASSLPKGYVIRRYNFVTAGTGRYDNPLTSRIDEYLKQFCLIAEEVAYSNARLTVFGHTGVSYHTEMNSLETPEVYLHEAARSAPVVVSVSATYTEIRRLEATRLMILSPYPEPVHSKGVEYWNHREDIEVCWDLSLAGAGGADSIYTLQEPEMYDETLSWIKRNDIKMSDVDLILFTGTGAPSLKLLPELELATGVPTLSVNKAVAIEVGEHLDLIKR